MPDCIFCDASPCKCNDRTRKGRKAAPVPPKITPPPRLSTSASLVVGPNTDLPVLTPPKIRATGEKPQALDTTQSEWDAEVAACLRVLEPILHEDEVRNYSHILGVPPTRQERIITWRRMFHWRCEQRGQAIKAS